MKRLLTWGASSGLLLVLVAGFLGILNYRPLIATAKWEAVSTDGHKATVYHMLFNSNRLYLEFPETDNPRNRWFALDLRRKAAGKPNWPDRTPYLHVNQGQGIGVGLTGMKIGQPWQIDWGTSANSFVGPDFTFTLEKPGANKSAMVR